MDSNIKTTLHKMDRTISVHSPVGIPADVGPSSQGSKPPSEKYVMVDYVLAYNPDRDEAHPTRKPYRDFFIESMQEEGLIVNTETTDQMTFLKLTCPFARLALEAERTKLEMPLKGLDINPADPSCCGSLQRAMTTDDEVDFVSAPFQIAKFHLFHGSEDKITFFRSALRGFLVYNILININIEEKLQGKSSEDVVQRRGLLYLLMKRAFADGFVLHDQSALDRYFLRIKEASHAEYIKTVPDLKSDARKDMHNTWTKFWKFQPLWKIRNYFGEQIAFYFAWIGTFLTLLWIPSVLGLAIFIYGIYESYRKNSFSCSDAQFTNTTKGMEACSGNNKYKTLGEDMLGVIKESFDNVFTPCFSLVICLWSTLFLEIWKRHRYTLAYQWDVDNYSMAEPDRPEFFGTCKRTDPVTGELAWIYPLSSRLRKYFLSVLVSFGFIVMVFASVATVVAFKVGFRVHYNCTSDAEEPEYEDAELGDSKKCMFFVVILPLVTNVVSIFILGNLYERMAVRLTEWENYRTQTEYNDALIIKLFAFQFANTYTSLFYMGFYRPDEHGFQENGIFNWGSRYKDTCQKGHCMSLLSFQVLVLMIMKPVPKFFKDIVWPWFLSLIRKTKRKISKSEKGKLDEASQLSKDKNNFIEREYMKPNERDFTMGEYTEKVIMYGYIVMFSASFPIAPLLALIICFVDVRIDAERLLWLNRRPVAFIASDIGMWYPILQFVNLCGAVSNGFIVGFTSSYCDLFHHPEQCTPDRKLMIAIQFILFVLLAMYIINSAIPDIPSSIILAQRRQRYQIMKILEESKVPSKLVNRDVNKCTQYITLPKVYYSVNASDHTAPESELEIHQPGGHASNQSYPATLATPLKFDYTVNAMDNTAPESELEIHQPGGPPSNQSYPKLPYPELPYPSNPAETFRST